MVDVARYDLGGTTLTRVPYFDIGLGAEALGLSDADVAAAADPEDPWTEGDQVLVGQALWVVDAPGVRLVIDPCGASDAFLRTGPEAIGHQEAVIAALTAVSGITALRALDATGCVEGIDDGAEIAPGVTVEGTGAHSPGHALVHVVGEERAATFLGHLSLTPLNLPIRTPSGNHADPEASDARLRDEARAAQADGRLLIGPLWPWPGACTVTDGIDRPQPATPDA